MASINSKPAKDGALHGVHPICAVGARLCTALRSASACSLLASRFEDNLQLTMTPGKDRVIALSYTLPTVPPCCPTSSPLPRIALDEVVFNTTPRCSSPRMGPSRWVVHEASFLPPAAAAAAQRQARQTGVGAPAQVETAARGVSRSRSSPQKYWMYILPVMVLMMAGGGPEEGDGKGEGRPAAAAGSGAARRK